MSGSKQADRKGIRSDMWCRDCHKEVDVKAAGTSGATCPLCGRALTASTRQTDDIRRAYEILERWQSSDLFERISTTAPLTTLKQQDRAPLLNIPLTNQKPVAPVPPVNTPLAGHAPAAATAVQQRPAISLQTTLPVTLGPPRVTLNRRLPNPPAPDGSSPDQVLWDLLVAPRPLLATAAPAKDEQDRPAPVVPEAMVAGVTERRPRQVQSNRASETLHAQEGVHAQELAETIDPIRHPEPIRASAPARMSNAMVDEVMADAASPSAVNPFDISDFSDWEAESDTHAASVDVPAAPVIEFAASELTDCADEDVSTYGNEFADLTLADSVHSDVPAQQAAAKECQAVETHVSEFISPETSPANLLASAEVLQTVLPVPKSSASIYVESAEYEANSADSANDIKQAQTNTTKNSPKTRRPALRRPPLNRRFQLERSVSESSAGSDTVTRKLRLDQTGADAETQASDPVTSLPSSVAPETKIVSNSPKPGRRFRIDSAEPVDVVTETDGRRVRTQGLPKRRYIDEAHESQMRGPHFEVSMPRRSNLTSMTGQFLAYLGVLGLTVGTAMVIYGHFGGYSEYTPTGWLVTTVAQMLLFLGVINLVSGGIEQNNEDVSRRINTLGEQLMRIEQVTSDAVRGPKLPAHMYAEDAAAAHESSTRETVTVHRQ